MGEEEKWRTESSPLVASYLLCRFLLREKFSRRRRGGKEEKEEFCSMIHVQIRKKR